MKYIVDPPDSFSGASNFIAHYTEMCKALENKIPDDVTLRIFLYTGSESGVAYYQNKYGYPIDTMVLDISYDGDNTYTVVIPAKNVYFNYFTAYDDEKSFKTINAWYANFIDPKWFNLFPLIVRDRLFPQLNTRESYLSNIITYGPREEIAFPPRDTKVIALDIETDSLDFTRGKMTVCSAAWRVGDNYIGFSAPVGQYLKWLYKLCETPEYNDLTFVFHNMNFDLPWLLKGLSEQNSKDLWWIREHFHGTRKIYDTMVMNQMVENSKLFKRRNNLARLSRVYLGADVKELFKPDEIKKVFEKGTDLFSDELHKQLMVYSAADSMATIALYDRIRARYGDFPRMGELLDFVQAYHKILCEMRFLGLPVDKTYLGNMRITGENNIRTIVNNIQKHPLYLQYLAETGKGKLDISSSAQMLHFFSFYDPQAVTTDYEYISKYTGELGEFAQLLLKYRELVKINSTYVKSIMNKIVDNCIHPEYSVANTETYRISSSDPNIQNLPRDSGVREAIVAPAGCKFVSFDYKQLEVCVLAALSKDPVLLAALKNGEDIHREWTEKLYKLFPLELKIYEKDTEEETIMAIRSSVVKSMWTFALFYGAGYKKICAGIGIDPDNADNYPKICTVKNLITSFWKKYVGVRKWQKDITDMYATKYMVTFPTGFIRQAPLSYNEIINGVVQSVGASVTNSALVNLYQLALKTKQEHFIPRIHVHDELNFFIPEQEVAASIDLITQEMCGAAARFPFLEGVDFKVTHAITDRWEKH